MSVKRKSSVSHYQLDEVSSRIRILRTKMGAFFDSFPDRRYRYWNNVFRFVISIQPVAAMELFEIVMHEPSGALCEAAVLLTELLWRPNITLHQCGTITGGLFTVLNADIDYQALYDCLAKATSTDWQSYSQADFWKGQGAYWPAMTTFCLRRSLMFYTAFRIVSNIACGELRAFVDRSPKPHLSAKCARLLTLPASLQKLIEKFALVGCTRCHFCRFRGS